MKSVCHICDGEFEGMGQMVPIPGGGRCGPCCLSCADELRKELAAANKPEEIDLTDKIREEAEVDPEVPWFPPEGLKGATGPNRYMVASQEAEESLRRVRETGRAVLVASQRPTGATGTSGCPTGAFGPQEPPTEPGEALRRFARRLLDKGLQYYGQEPAELVLKDPVSGKKKAVQLGSEALGIFVSRAELDELKSILG
jgi:hypothetical protein